MENKTIVENNTQLRIVFNFAARRVSEIYQFNQVSYPSVVRDFSFDDYGPVAVENARQKLIAMGGRPSDDPGILIGKKNVIRPLGVKLSKDIPSP